MNAVVVTELGGPEVLTWTEIEDPVADDGVIVEVAAAGLNFIDTYQRSGLYPIRVPFIPGLEGSGTVVSAPAGSGFSAGDRVAWADGQGSYAERVSVHPSKLTRIPEGVEFDTAAAVMLQGMTAHYLAMDTFPLQPGHRCLVHAGAGGVGLLLIQIAKLAGADVYATVGSTDKADLARSAGADLVIDYTTTDFAAAITEAAGSRPLDVVYDGVGRATFQAGLGLLKRRGMMVTFGNASGPPDPVPPLTLMQNGSLYVTRPTMFDYVTNRTELDARARDLFGWVSDGRLDVRVGTRLPMRDAEQAHRMLEGRSTTGKVLLIP
ncbi:MAG: quinone oxidoreductase [Acidimicrobiia bacterium]|nr:quinone oxidoreductase [Acidimicrobiia bacterium]MDH4307046.1 quinone oxidoreductase [Acidimicrobiia bacterium]MDH5294853.1 quinone oxidoreductase [Acidimicrobiia bacterium]